MATPAWSIPGLTPGLMIYCNVGLQEYMFKKKCLIGYFNGGFCRPYAIIVGFNIRSAEWKHVQRQCP